MNVVMVSLVRDNFSSEVTRITNDSGGDGYRPRDGLYVVSELFID